MRRPSTSLLEKTSFLLLPQISSLYCCLLLMHRDYRSIKAWPRMSILAVTAALALSSVR